MTCSQEYRNLQCDLYETTGDDGECELAEDYINDFGSSRIVFSSFSGLIGFFTFVIFLLRTIRAWNNSIKRFQARSAGNNELVAFLSVPYTQILLFGLWGSLMQVKL